MKKILLSLTALMLLGCAGSIISIPDHLVNDPSAMEYNIYGYYALPKTAIKIQIPVARNALKPGLVHEDSIQLVLDKKALESLKMKYSKTADPNKKAEIKKKTQSVKNLEEQLDCLKSLLKTNFGWEPEKAPEEKFSLDKKIIFSPLTIPDSAKRFAIGYKKAKTISQTLNVKLSKDGLIQSGEFAQESKAYDIAKKSLELIANTVGALAGLKEQPIETLTGACNITNLKNKRAAQLIKDANLLVNTRLGLLVNAPSGVNNKEILEMYLARIDKQLKQIKTALVGTITKKVHYLSIRIDPKEPPKDGTIELLKLNPQHGIVSNDSDTNDRWRSLSDGLRTNQTEGAKPLVLVWEEVYDLGMVREAGLEIVKPGEDLGTNTTNQDNSNNEKPKLLTDAFLYYNIPAKYELSLRYGGKPVPSFKNKQQKEKEGVEVYNIYFPQFGKIAYLPKDFKEADVVYYQDIGALKSAKYVKEAQVTAERIEGIYTAADSLRRVIEAAKEAESAEDAVEEDDVEEEVEEQIIRLIIQNDGTTIGAAASQ